jgi:hemerythrin-like metal-binding protein
MAFEWDGTLETGDPLVDQQHRRIHELVGELERAEDTPAELMRVLDHLAVHVDTHFATEERLMVAQAYPQELADAHRAEHAALTQSTRAIIVSFRKGELRSLAPVLEFLRGWLANHVHKCDLQLIEYCRARGSVAVLPRDYDDELAKDVAS